MTPREAARLRRKIEKMTPEEMVAAHSEAMAVVEGVWRETAQRLCAARDSETCPRMVAAALAEDMMFSAKAFHRKADALAAQSGHLLPGGQAVPVRLVGSR